MSLPMTAGAAVVPQATLATSVTADTPPGPAENAGTDGTDGAARQGGPARKITREDAEEENALGSDGNDPIIRKALADDDADAQDPAPARPPAPPANAEAPATAPQNTAPAGQGSAPRSAVQRPAGDRRVPQSPTIQGRHPSAPPRGSAGRSAHRVQGHRASAPQPVAATRPGSAQPANADRSWRQLVDEKSPQHRAARWEED